MYSLFILEDPYAFFIKTHCVGVKRYLLQQEVINIYPKITPPCLTMFPILKMYTYERPKLGSKRVQGCIPKGVDRKIDSWNIAYQVLNIILIHNINCCVGLTIFHEIFWIIDHIQTECGKYSGLFHGILAIPQNIGMDLNNVIYAALQARRNIGLRIYCMVDYLQCTIL